MEWRAVSGSGTSSFVRSHVRRAWCGGQSLQRVGKLLCGEGEEYSPK